MLETEVKAINNAIISAKQISLLASDIKSMDKEIQSLENELAASGSVKTMGQIQQEQQEVQTKWYVLHLKAFIICI
jgi:hypothetical protein